MRPGGIAGTWLAVAAVAISSLASAQPLELAEEPAEWRWTHILSPPRIGGRFRSIAVDPQNPRRIYVGTEEGTMLITSDGGATWREIEMDPAVIQRRSLYPSVPGLPSLGAEDLVEYQLFADPPYRPRPTSRIQLLFDTLFFSIKPDFLRDGGVLNAEPEPNDFLFSTVRERPSVPVVRIAVCPGATYELLVANEREVFGSRDGGLTYVRLLRVAGVVWLHHVVCSQEDPNHVLAATGFGLFRSRDGGVTWDQDLSGWPGRNATAVSFGQGNDVFVGTDHVVFAGDPDSDSGLQMVYPDFNNVATAPWRTVRWIEPNDDAIWLGTSDGVRVSYDRGQNWINMAPNLFSRHRIYQVAVGANEEGGTRVAVLARDCPFLETERQTSIYGTNRWMFPPCRVSNVYASDDLGETWFPAFVGGTRRVIRQIAAAPAVRGVPPRWWIVTDGGLWASVPPQMSTQYDFDQESAEWALARLRTTPSLYEATETALQANDLRDRDIRWPLAAPRNSLPDLDVQFAWTNFNTSRHESVTPIDPREIDEVSERPVWSLIAYATWTFAGLMVDDSEQGFVEFNAIRNAVFDLRNQVTHVIEDAWHERWLLLQRIANGMSDRLQIEVTKQRIYALEAVLETWLRQPLERVSAGG